MRENHHMEKKFESSIPKQGLFPLTLWPLLLVICVTLNKLLNFSVPQVCHLLMGLLIVLSISGVDKIKRHRT